MERMGEEKLYFLLLKSVKRKKSPVWGDVSQFILSPIVSPCLKLRNMFVIEEQLLQSSCTASDRDVSTAFCDTCSFITLAWSIALSWFSSLRL